MNRIDYGERLGRVRAYIHAHLDDDLDLRVLAEIACLSPYHWHRTYHAIYGETAAATVKRLRLHRAAALLVQTDLPVHDIAFRSGYGNLQSFTRIFRDTYGIPPATYRRSGHHVAFQTRARDLPSGHYPVGIEAFAPFTIMAAPHEGSYMTIAEAFDRVDGWLLAEQAATAVPERVGLYYDDPFAIVEADLRSMAGRILDGACPPPGDGIEPVEVRGGRYAVLRYRGPYAGMHAAYRWLFGVWVVESGFAVADAPLVEVYRNDPATTAPDDLLTDIRMPLRAPAD
ncbi:MAG: GyrI-like domain-containing protein [Thermomicrobiales bacterium]